MKKINIIYWISTGIFAALMLLSAIPDAMVNNDAINIMVTQLGYPKYIIPFIGIAKIIGAIVILIPGFPRLKEWAYAGLGIDLAGAIYSGLAVKPDPMMLTFAIWIVPGIISYIYYHKRLSAKQN